MNCPACEQPAPAGAVECSRCGGRLVPSEAELASLHPGYGLHSPYGAPFSPFPPSSVADLGRALTGMLFISAITQAALVALNGTSGPRQAMQALNLLLFVGIAVVFLIWFFRVRKNAGMWGPQSRSQGWTIGAWFCPVVNIWFPVQIMRDVWRSSTDDPARQTSVARWAGAWWTFWLLTSVAGIHTDTVRSIGSDGSVVVTHRFADSLDGTWMSALCLGIGAILLERVVSKITAMQVARGVG